MSIQNVRIVLGAVLLFGTLTTIAQSYDQSELALFRTLSRQTTDLGRYTYLTNAIPSLSSFDKSVARQLLASSEDELGLYDQAILGFPLKSHPIANLSLPTATDWYAANAVETITRLAASRRIVMINEAHHNAHTRQLTLALLPRLRKLGFTYFAAEALDDKDPGLAQRGYPIKISGSEYLHEPIYGEIVREAIRLGFIIVPYDSEAATTQAREIAQADNLYNKIFAKDPSARLFVHAGYAHIDKSEGRLGHVETMAMRLRLLTGIEPFSIDQTQFLEDSLNQSDVYHQLIANFQPEHPVVLVNRRNKDLWSANPRLYDVNVILPATVSLESFGDEGLYGERSDEKSMRIDDTTRLSGKSPILNNMRRPAWLKLGGMRRPFPINVALCRMNVPCMIEAHYSDESDDAIAADRYAFLKPGTISELYLNPGRYRLRALSDDGKILSDQVVDIEK